MKKAPEGTEPYFLSDSADGDDAFGLHDSVSQAVLRFATSAQGIRKPFVIGLFGPWGSGKSKVLHLIEQEARDAGDIVTVSLDAWRQTPESFLRALLSKVAKSLNPNADLQQINQKKNETVNRFALRAWFVPFIFLLPALLWYLDVYSLSEEIPQVVYNSLVAFATVLAVQMLLVTAKKTETIERRDFNDPDFFLEKLVGILEKAPEKQILIMVDNLDRCAAQDAIDIIRRIKTFLVDPADGNEHLQSVTFIVACDEKELRKHIKTHGVEDPHDYLRKFFNIPVHIPALHRSDMYQFIKGQIEKVDNKIGLSLPNEEKQKIANIILAAFADTPRQVKRFLNKFVAMLHVLKIQESNTRFHGLNPSDHPSAVALFLACRSFGIHPKEVPTSSNNNYKEAVKRLASLNYHQDIENRLWNALELLRDPRPRHALARWSEMFAAFERSSRHNVEALCRPILENEPMDDRAAYLDELAREASTSKHPENIKLARLIVLARKEGLVKTLNEPAVQFLSQVLHQIDVVTWPEIDGDGEAVARALLSQPHHVRPVLEKIERGGAPDNEPVGFLQAFLSTMAASPDEVAPDAVLSRTMEARGQRAPALVAALLSARPHLATEDLIGFLAPHWQQHLEKTVEIIQKFTPKQQWLLASQILASGGLAQRFQQQQSIQEFLDAGGIELLKPLFLEKEAWGQNAKTTLQNLVTWMAGHLPSLGRKARPLLKWLDQGLELGIVERQWLHSVIGQIGQPHFLQSAFDYGGAEAFVEIPNLLDAIMALHSPQITALLQVAANHLNQAPASAAPEDVPRLVENACKLVQRARSQNIRIQLDLLSFLAELPEPNEADLPILYELIFEHIDDLIWQQGESVQTIEGILEVLNRLTGLKPPIPEEPGNKLDELIHRYRAKDYSPKGQRLRRKWKQALSPPSSSE